MAKWDEKQRRRLEGRASYLDRVNRGPKRATEGVVGDNVFIFDGNN